MQISGLFMQHLCLISIFLMFKEIVSHDFESLFMISSHYSHISTRHGAYLFFFKNLFSFGNCKFLSFAVVLYACELIPAMGAPAASKDLLHKIGEKVADAHTTASSI
jgi:hypothetical protein